MIVWTLIGILVFCVLMLFRNSWVYKVRIAVLDNSRWDGGKHVEFKSLPSYDYMMLRFWIWDVKKFLPLEHQGISISRE